MNADHRGAKAGVPSGQRPRWPAAEPAGMPPPPTPGTAQAGRHREHLFPGRPHRVSPSFGAQEYAAVVAAAARIGLTPSGYCAHAALAFATSPGAPPQTTTAAAFGSAGRDAATVEALAALQAELADTRTAVVRVGTNLNQSVRVLNATGEVPRWLQHVAELCARALAAVDATAAAIHRRL